MGTHISVCQEASRSCEERGHTLHQMPGLREARSSIVPASSEEAISDLAQEGIFIIWVRFLLEMEYWVLVQFVEFGRD